MVELASGKQNEIVKKDMVTNEVVLVGYICKKPIYRQTPFGREISDLLIATNRPYGRSDYIPSIVWGRYARKTSKKAIGTRIFAKGRIQSREYIKKLDNGEIEMSILTNHSRLQGAAGMLHKEIIKQYMKETKADKVWIIPSSIHETLLIPCDLMPDMEYVKNMVKEVNATQVQPEEILSDNVYVYDGNEITIAE